MIGLNVWEHRRWIQQNSGIWLKAAGYLQAWYILPVKIISNTTSDGPVEPQGQGQFSVRSITKFILHC